MSPPQVVFTEVNGKRHEPVEEVLAVPSLNCFTKISLSAESRTRRRRDADQKRSRRVAGCALRLTGNGSNVLPMCGQVSIEVDDEYMGAVVNKLNARKVPAPPPPPLHLLPPLLTAPLPRLRARVTSASCAAPLPSTAPLPTRVLTVRNLP